MVRRLAAIALAGALLHLNVARADAACGTHEHASTAAETHTGHELSEHHGAHGEPTGAPATGHDEQNCETPVQQDCCIALVSCSLALGSVESMSAASALSHEGAIGALDDLPVSLVSTPDTPPPKA